MRFRKKEASNVITLGMQIIQNSTPADTFVARILERLRTPKIQEYLDDPEHDRLDIVYFTDIILPTGNLVGTDALWIQNEPYLGKVHPGKYPVYLYIYHSHNDQRIAYAEIRFSNLNPVLFYLARTAKNKHVVLTEKEYVGFGVDTGTACFMDEAVAKHITRNSLIENSYYRRLRDLFEEDYNKAQITAAGAQGNVVAFSSGYGDGSYGSYWCLDEQLELCSILTDFNVIEIPEPGQPRTWMWEETDVMGRTNRQRLQQGLPPIDETDQAMLLHRDESADRAVYYQISPTSHFFLFPYMHTKNAPKRRDFIAALQRRKQLWMQYTEQGTEKSIPEFNLDDMDDLTVLW